jgi:hypothetical protein
MSAAVLLFLLRLIRLEWLEIGFWFGDTVVEGMMRWIRRRGWKECRIKTILIVFTTLGGALVALLNLLLLCRHSASLDWIAACVYFAWSPELACAGLLVVCGVVGWITIFIHAPYVRASVGSKTIY